MRPSGLKSKPGILPILWARLSGFSRFRFVTLGRLKNRNPYTKTDCIQRVTINKLWEFEGDTFFFSFLVKTILSISPLIRKIHNIFPSNFAFLLIVTGWFRICKAHIPFASYGLSSISDFWNYLKHLSSKKTGISSWYFELWQSDHVAFFKNFDTTVMSLTICQIEVRFLRKRSMAT